MQNHFQKLFFSILAIIALSACSGNLTTVEIETPEMQLSAEGPLFEGANSATATWEFDINELLGEVEGKVSKAKVSAVEVTLKPSEGSPALEKMVFEVTSKNTSMTRVGLFEGSINEGETFYLNIADQQENLAKAFEDGRITFVGDFDLLEEEFWGNLEFSLKVKFELGIK
ncbi:hypothetical protein [Belliella pelovolcani]|uniref:hypothetical protein n=1 Tax=Belliella pelovolcani TaxID=529505 RepID=UPI00391CF615